MVKISTHEGEQVVRLQIEGALAGVWVKELELSWRTALANLRGRSLRVDLTGTTSVDMAGCYLLTLMHKEGAEFVVSGPSMRALCSEITDHATAAQGETASRCPANGHASAAGPKLRRSPQR